MNREFIYGIRLRLILLSKGLRDFWLRLVLTNAIVCWAAASHAQPTEEILFITSPDDVTLEMLSVAGVKRGDHVIHLGSGAGPS